MKKQQKSILVLAITAAFIAAMFLPGLISAGVLDPIAAPGPTMKTLDEVEPRIPISSIPYTISSPGSYYVTQNLQCPDQSNCPGIRIEADDVTLDLMGHTIIGPGPSDLGIGVIGRNNVEIRNGSVTGFYQGVAFYKQDNVQFTGGKIIDMRIFDSTYAGIYFLNIGAVIKDCIVMNNGSYGIIAPFDALIDGCTVVGQTINISIEGSQTFGVNHAP